MNEKVHNPDYSLTYAKCVILGSYHCSKWSFYSIYNIPSRSLTVSVFITVM